MTLPGESAQRLQAAAHELRHDRVHGAMELALRAVEIAVDLLMSDTNALTLSPFADRGDAEAVRQEAESRTAAWRDEDRHLLENVLPHIPEVILTYSHASTTRNVLLAMCEHLRHVIIPEGRPVDDGKRLATILAAAGIPVTVITEAQMGWWVPQVEAVVVGADTVTPGGDVVNHMGTATLALIARSYGTPMYSLTHTLKIAPSDRPEDLREENDPAEIWANPPAGITIRNPAFDHTPAAQITVITERGILTDELRNAVVAEHREAWHALGLDGGDAVSS